MSFEAMQMLIEKGMQDLESEQERIFGPSDEEELKAQTKYIDQRQIKEKYEVEVPHTVYVAQGVTETVMRTVEKTRKKKISEETTKKAFDDFNKELEEGGNNALRRILEIKPGAFNEHVGYAPKMRKDASPDNSMSKNMLFEGKGELGRIMSRFMHYNVLHQAGLAEVDKPVYDRKMWDDRNMPFEAPNIRVLSDIAVGVVATVATAGMAGPAIVAIAASTAISMIDDAVFAVADLANGKDASQVGLNFGKKAISSFATSAIGGAFNGVKGADPGFFNGGLSNAFGETAFGSAMSTGTQMAVSNVASSAINAVEFQNGSLSFNTDSFREGTVGTNAMTGYLAGMASSFVTTGLNNNFKNINTHGFAANLNLDTDSFGSFTGLAGTATASLIEYGITGETTLNILSVADVLVATGLDEKMGFDTAERGEARMQRFKGSGLLEYPIGGDRKAFAIGQGGRNVSLR